MSRKRSSRRRGRGGQEDALGMPLMDLITTALGCILLIFIVYSIVTNFDIRRFISKNANLLNELYATQKERDALRENKTQITQENERLERELRTLLTTVDRIKDQSVKLDLQNERLKANLKGFLGQLKVYYRSITPGTAKPLDVMLVIDGTSSMKPSIEAVRQNMQAIVGSLQILSPSARVGVTIFRDPKDSKKMQIQHQPLTQNSLELKSFLDDVKAKSGSKDTDRPEWLCKGMSVGLKGMRERRPKDAGWRERSLKIMVVVSDAASISPGAETCIALAKTFNRDHEGVIHVMSTTPDRYKRSKIITEEYNQIVLRDHALIAKAGGGSHFKRAHETRLLEEVLRFAFESRLKDFERLKEILAANSWLTDLEWEKANGE